MSAKISFLKEARDLLDAGLCVLPAAQTKAPGVPSWKQYQTQLPVADELDEWFSARSVHGFGIICGAISGGLEVVDVDAKNDPAGTLNERVKAAVQRFTPGLWERLVIERTPSGGLHLFYRITAPSGNTKLAHRPDAKGKPAVLVETRGEGGFIVCTPSPGYVLKQGNLSAVPELSDDDHETLFAALRSLDEMPEKPAEPASTYRENSPGLTPLDDYNARGDVLELLRAHGWHIGTEHADGSRSLRRPGKERGISATWNHKGRRTLCVFSSSTEFQTSPTTYSPAAVFAVLVCGGDFKQAAAELRRLGYGSKLAEAPLSTPQAQGSERITGSKVDPASKWPKPVSAFDLCETPPTTPDVLIDGVLYRGGTMLISGPSKSHKTYTMLDLACALAEGRPWLGFETVQCPVLYVNLELQDFATQSRIAQICTAAGKIPPRDLHLWNLRGHEVSLAALTAHLPAMIQQIGAGFVVIDPHYKVSSVSDMEENSNDSQGKLLAALEGLCGLNGAALAVCHHFAKGDASAKTAIDRASGGGVFARWGDVMMTFTPHEEDEAMAVEMSLRNFAPVSPFVVRWDHPRWARDAELDPSKLRKRGRGEVHTADKALSALGDGLLTWSQWLNAAGMSESTFRRKLGALIEANKVEQVGQCYRRKAA